MGLQRESGEQVRIGMFAIWLLLLPSGEARAQNSSDACQRQVPQALAGLLAARFPSFHLPSVSDSLDEDVRFDVARGGNGCLLVGRGDFDGDRQQDLAIGLAPNRPGEPIVVVALRRSTAWTTAVLESWVDDVSRLFVDSVPPGTHNRTQALDGPLDPGERRSMRCATQAVLVGASESTGIAYCYLNSQWLHVWVAD